MNDLHSFSLNFSPNLSKFSAAFLSYTFKINYQCATARSLLSLLQAPEGVTELILGQTSLLQAELFVSQVPVACLSAAPSPQGVT